MRNMEKNINENDNIINEEILKKHEEEQKENDKIESISYKMEEFIEVYKKYNLRKENLDALEKYINASIGILKASQLLYIPMMGKSNAGKSTILNGIIGSQILPARKNECTKKGILIRHWNKNIPVLRKTYFLDDNEVLSNSKYYYFKSSTEPIAKGIKDIRRQLEATNYDFGKKEKDFFYEIDVNIQFINELEIDDNLKEKICFIDLPGFGTNNPFEKKNVYESLLRSCDIFLFIVFNLIIKDNNIKKMMDKLFIDISGYRGITSEAFIKQILFIVNSDKSQEISDKTLLQAKRDIISISKKDQDNKNVEERLKDIKVCFFNAKYYEDYINVLRYYKEPRNLIETEFNEYLQLKRKVLTGLLDTIKGGTFPKYLIAKLKDKISKDINGDKGFKEKDVNPNEIVEKEVNKAVIDNSLNFKFSKKELNLIIKYISFGYENISDSILKKESKYDNFKNFLEKNINRAKQEKDKNINNNLLNCFKILDDVFEVSPQTRFGKCADEPVAKVVKPHVQEDLNNMKLEIERYLNLINNEFVKNDIIKILDSCALSITNTLTKEKSDIINNLKNKKWSVIQKGFEDIFQKETRELKSQLLTTLKEASKNIKNYYDQCYNKLDQFYLKANERKSILYENYISNSLGGNNNIEESLEQLINDIIKGSKTATDWKNSDGFWSWLGSKVFDDNYLNKIIDYILKNSTPKIKTFSDTIKNYVNSFKTMINDEIKSSKGRVEKEMEERKEKERL